MLYRLILMTDGSGKHVRRPWESNLTAAKGPVSLDEAVAYIGTHRMYEGDCICAVDVEPTERIYVAGPMTGIPQFNFPAFDRAAEKLRDAGYDVISPAELDEPEVRKAALDSPDGALEGEFSPETYASFLARDVEIVAGVDGVALLPGWENSRGAQLEVRVAELFDIPRYLLDLEREHGEKLLIPFETEAQPFEREPSVLEEATDLIHGARQKQYGHPIEDFSRTAKMWEAILGVEVPVEKVPLCMIAVKMSRAVESPQKRDSIVDICGYAGTYEMVQERRGEPLE